MAPHKGIALGLVFFLGAACHAQAQKTIIIANRSTHASQLPLGDIRDLFVGASTTFRNGVHAQPAVLSGGPEQDAFLKEFIGKLDSSFRNGWRSLVFSGQARMIKIVADDEEMIAFVAKTPGAIGYISRTSSAASREGVITVTVR